MSLAQHLQNTQVLSLFSGAGVLDLGFEQIGFVPRFALDVDKSAVDTYNRNRWRDESGARVCHLANVKPSKLVALWEEISPTKPPIGIIGGHPCQGFSVSNAHKFQDDPRSQPPLSYAKSLAEFNRCYGLDLFVFENVFGLGHSPP